MLIETTFHFVFDASTQRSEKRSRLTEQVAEVPNRWRKFSILLPRHQVEVEHPQRSFVHLLVGHYTNEPWGVGSNSYFVGSRQKHNMLDRVFEI